MSKAELKLLLRELKKEKCETVGQTRCAIYHYFSKVVMSILKMEWEQMTPSQKEAFIVKAHNETRLGKKKKGSR